MERNESTKTDRRRTIRPRVREAVRLIVTEGRSISDAAESVGMHRESLSRALKRPDVVQLREDVRRTWLKSETAKAWNTVAYLAEHAASEDVRHKAARTILEAMGELRPKGDSSTNAQALVQIVLSGGATATDPPRVTNGVIEAAPMQFGPRPQ